MRNPECDETEPDVAIVRGSTGSYRRPHPIPDEVVLLIVVSETTLSRDRGVKRALTPGPIPVYSIVNLVIRQVEVSTRPTPEGRYRSLEAYKTGRTSRS